MNPHITSVNCEMKLTEAQYNFFFFGNEWDYDSLPDFIQELDGGYRSSEGRPCEWYMTFTLQNDNQLGQAAHFFQDVINAAIYKQIANLEGLRGKA